MPEPLWLLKKNLLLGGLHLLLYAILRVSQKCILPPLFIEVLAICL